MASEFAAPPSQVPQQQQQDEMDSSFQKSSSFEDPKPNGIHDSAPTSMQPSDLATGGKLNIPEDQGHLPIQETEVVVPDPNPSAPSPVNQVDSGISPLADFIPKDGLNNSHPTPPPDEPLTSGTADVDIEMAESGPDPATISSPGARSPPPAPVPSESSLVRPREDDEEDVPAAKRSKVDDAPTDIGFSESEVLDPLPVEEAAVVETPAAPVSAVEPAPEAIVEDVIAGVGTPAVEEPVDTSITEPAIATAIEGSITRAVEPVVEEPVERIVEPAVESTMQASAALPVESVSESVADPVVEDGDVAMQDSKVEDQTSDVAALPLESASAVAALSETPIAETPVDEKPMLPPATPAGQPPAVSEPTAAAEEPAKYSTAPMTKLQKDALVERTKNLKKTKNSVAFLRPVDHVALNIPTYPDIVKQPMDLSTMDSKLKNDQYASVQDFANDFELIISNVRRFNGDQHAVTQAGFSMQAYFNRMMQSVPSADEKAAPRVEKKRSPSLPRAEKPRRESRAPAQPAAPAVTAASASAPAQTEQFALVDGTPQIRRQSSLNRPARAIKPVQNREIEYAKPKRKEHQLELRFCEHILEQLKSARFQSANQIFGQPVDPVALNIPHYRQIIKTPMDLATMTQKLRGGQYGTAGEFKKDFDLMIKNCLTFNPVGNPVRDLGIQFQRDFETMWQGKDAWERKNAPPSNRASSASGDEESVADDEEDDEVDEEDDKTATIKALQKQLAQMQNALSGLGGSDKQAKSKKSKAAQGSSKKSGGSSSKAVAPVKKTASKPAAKPKKPRLVTYEEKQEISEAVGNMNDQQLQRVTEIITQHDPKYRDMEEMELEIDELTTEVQNMLLDYVRKVFGNPNKKKAREASPDDAAALDDDDYEERGGGGGARGGKRKKHRPMGKKEQQDTISAIQEKLSAFKNQTGTSGSESPTNSSFVAAKAEADSSGDEESEESEEE